MQKILKVVAGVAGGIAVFLVIMYLIINGTNLLNRIKSGIEAYMADEGDSQQQVGRNLSCKSPLGIYQYTWTTRVEEDIPVDQISMVGPDTRSVTHYVKIAGGLGSTVVQRWYKNGEAVAETEFEIWNNVWSVWSEQVIDDYSAKWGVKLFDASGCEIMAQNLATGSRTNRKELQKTSWKRKEAALNELILSSDQRANFLIERLVYESDKDSYLNSRTSSGDTPLLLAIRVGNADAVEALLKVGASPFVWDADGVTALELARELGDLKIADQLDIVIFEKTPSWSTLYSLVSRTEKSQPDSRVMVVSEFDKPVYGITKTSGLTGHVVKHEWWKGGASSGSVAYATDMRVNGDADVIVSRFTPHPGHEMWTLNVYVDGKRKDNYTFWTNLKRQSGSNKQDMPFVPSYNRAIEALGKAWAPVSMIGSLIEMNGDADNKKIYEKLSYEAVVSGNIDLLQYMTEHNRTIAKKYDRKPIVLHALENKRYAVLSYLLAGGFNANEVEQHYRRTAMHYAAKTDDVLGLQILFDAGADIEARNMENAAPLHEAAQACAKNAARFLVTNNADKEPMDKNNQKPLDLVSDSNCMDRAYWTSLLMHR